MKLKQLIFYLASILLVLLHTRLTSGDTLYKEGFYDQDAIAGAIGDPRDEKTPAVPFIVNTNRYGDGITTTSAFTSTSPRFPYYTGAVANVSDRYLRYTEYKKSAAEQGIAMIGDGLQQREEARLKITNIPNYELLPAPSKEFMVYAAVKWNPSDFAIQEGEVYNVTVFGEHNGYSDQLWYDGGIRVNSEGYSSYFDAISNCYVGMGRCRSYLKKKRRLPSANWMSLACAVGEFVRPLTEIEAGKEDQYRWMPLDESTLIETIFNVGRTVQFRAVYSGQLICFANDAHTLYWNNHGQIKVTVTRVSWPPTNTTVYEDFLLPACDSAQVVYHNHGDNTPGPGKVKCNPRGGGSGWKIEEVLNTAGTYGSGAPSYIYDDLPPEVF